MVRSHVLVCGGTGCTSSGSVKIMDAMNAEIAAKAAAATQSPQAAAAFAAYRIITMLLRQAVNNELSFIDNFLKTNDN